MLTGEKIRKLRVWKGYSQEYMGQVIGLCQQEYSKIESGKTKVTNEMLLIVCKALEVDIKTIIEIDDNPTFHSHNQQGGHANNYFNAAQEHETNLSEKVSALLSENIKLKEDILRLIEENAQIRSEIGRSQA
jgi:transcriptional regulator with XRE-family HTH domain